MSPKIRKLMIAGSMVLFITAGTVRIAIDYRTGHTFQPFETNRNLKNDQLLFPDSSSAGTGGQNGSTDDSFWEQDPSQDETQGGGDGAGYLFQQTTQVSSSGSTATAGISGDGVSNVDGRPTDVVYDIVDRDDGSADIILPGEGGNGTLPGGDADDSGENSGGSVTPGGSTGETVIPGGEDTPSGGDVGTGGGGGSVTPTPTPNPADTVQNPEITEKPKPDFDITGNLESFREDLIQGEDPDNFTMSIYARTSSGSTLYWGQSVDEKELFNALDFCLIKGFFENTYYFGLDDLGTYARITGISFDGGVTKVPAEDFPVTIPSKEGTKLIIYVDYRLSKSSENWVSTEVPCTPNAYRVYVLNQQLTAESTALTQDMLLNGMDTLGDVKLDRQLDTYNLFYYLVPLLGKDGATLTSLFPGWTENGKLVPWFYTPGSGRHILEPSDLVPLAEDYHVTLQRYYMDNSQTVYITDPDNAAKNTTYLQTLVGYGNPSFLRSVQTYSHILRVPKYIQAVDITEEQLSTDQLVLPSTTLYLNLESTNLRVLQGYVVEEGNPHYQSRNGLLYNADGDQILGIPYEMEEVSIPAGVQRVLLNADNQITRLELETEDSVGLPEINLENLHDATIVLKSNDLLISFLEQYQDQLEATNSKAVSLYGEEYILQNGLVIEKQTGKLCRVYSGRTTAILPELVTSIGEGAFRSSDVTTLILSEDVEPTLEAGWFQGSGISTVFCYDAAQAARFQAALTASGAPGTIQVKLLSHTADNYTYYTDESGITTLLKAPENAVEFTGLSNLRVDVIGDSAFSQCQQLQWVTLPESVKEIGSSAFESCTALEGLLIDSRDTVSLGMSALEGCTSLRFVASNAEHMSRLNDYSPELVSNIPGYGDHAIQLYAPTVCDGYNGNWLSFDEGSDVDHYTMVRTGTTGRVLYGVNADGNASLAIRSGATADDTVLLPITTSIIWYQAFADTHSANDGGFQLVWDGDLFFDYEDFLEIHSYAFFNSGLMGDLELPDLRNIGTAVFAHTQLETVSFASVLPSCTLPSGLFAGCEKLTDIIFEATWDETPCGLSLLSASNSPFMFNGDWADWGRDSDHLKIHILDENGEEDTEEARELALAYVMAWRYRAAGYAVTPYYSSDYEAMWWDLWFDAWGAPDSEVDAELAFKLTDAENQLRTMMGLEQVTHPTRFGGWKENGGTVTLTDAYIDSEVFSFSAATDADAFDLPEGWYVDYLGTGVFRNSPNLRTVYADSLAALQTGAFSGRDESREIDLILDMETPIDLLPTVSYLGEPFDFTGLRSVSVPSGCEEAYLEAWVWQAAGYQDYSDMYTSIHWDLLFNGELSEELDEDGTKQYIDNIIRERLLPYENTVLALLGMPETNHVTVPLVEKEAPDGSDESDDWTWEPDFPDSLPDLPDLLPDYGDYGGYGDSDGDSYPDDTSNETPGQDTAEPGEGGESTAEDSTPDTSGDGESTEASGGAEEGNTGADTETPSNSASQQPSDAPADGAQTQEGEETNE